MNYIADNMPLEIEHKYLVNKELWRKVIPERSTDIKQSYLSSDPDKTIRIRSKENKAFICIKGRAHGATRAEFEYEIPFKDALEMMNMIPGPGIEKIRHLVLFKGKTWEVDEFKGLNAGLIVAELELQSEDETYDKPEWLSDDVTHDPKYANSNLALKPYSTW